MEKKSGAVLVEPLPQGGVDVQRAEATRLRELKRMVRPREDMVATITIEPKSSYPVSEVLDAVTEAVLCSRPSMGAERVRSDALWSETRTRHSKIMLAFLILDEIEATEIESGVLVHVKDGWPLSGLAELSVNRSGFEKFARATGVALYGGTKKERADLPESQYDRLIHIIGGLYLVAAHGKNGQYIREIASSIVRNIEKATGYKVSEKTVRNYLAEARKRGFKIEGAGSADEPT